MTGRRRPLTAPTATRAARPHHPSLAPEHLGELGGIAALAVLVAGFATFIAGVAMAVGGLTIGASFGAGPLPPDVASLGQPEILGGAGLMILGAALSAGSIATFAAVRRARMTTALLCALTVLLAAAGTVLLATEPLRDLVLIGALAVATVVFAAAAVILGRRSA